MTSTTYPDDLPVTTARARYFADNGFGDDGGYADPFVDLKLGPVTIPFPNTKGRAEVVPYHDLHHLVTGYGTDFASELAISAWEVGAGCGRSLTAWLIDLSGMGLGLVAAPRTTLRAFARGRRSRSLFDVPLAALMSETVGDLRKKTRVPAANAEPELRASDLGALTAAALGSLVAAPIVLGGTLAVMPFGLIAKALKR